MVLSYPTPFSTWAKCFEFDPDEQVAFDALSTRLGDTIYLAIQEANRQLVAEGRSGNVQSEPLAVDPARQEAFRQFVQQHYIFTNEGSGLTTDY